MPTVDDLRGSVEALARLAAADIDVLWRDFASAEALRDDLQDVLPQLVEVYGSAAGSVAADWYDEVRESAEVGRRFTAYVPDVIDPDGARVLARWAVDPLFQPEPDVSAARTLLEGGLQRRVANVARAAVTDSTVADPSAQGWQRVTSGRSCGFCVMLASRGAVYSERSVSFASHDACDCYAVPAFEGRPRPVDPFTPSQRRANDADRARVRAYLAQNNAG